jgi:hypothetical protein
MTRLPAISLLLLAVASLGAAVDFDREIRPLLRERCVECHGPKKVKANLRLDAKPHALKGGESGPAFVAGDPAKSLIFDRITTKDEDTKMPPKGEPLTPAQVANHYSGTIRLSIAKVGSQVVVTWPFGTLQESLTVSGIYADLPSATSPFTNAPSGTAKFYRVKIPN